MNDGLRGMYSHTSRGVDLQSCAFILVAVVVAADDAKIMMAAMSTPAMSAAGTMLPRRL
jgi:proline racemase